MCCTFNCLCLYIVIYQSTRHNIPEDLEIYNLLVLIVIILFLREVYALFGINLYHHLFRNVEAGTATANTKACSQIEGVVACITRVTFLLHYTRCFMSLVLF